MKPVIIYFLVTLLLASCTKDTDLTFPSIPEQLVINGILHPDSTIRVSISKSLAVVETIRHFPLVENALVYLYEDGVRLGSLQYDGTAYGSDYYPAPGKHYTVEVSVQGYPQVTASDIVPQKLHMTACYKPQAWYSYANLAIQTTIDDNRQESNYYWLGLLVKQYDSFDSIRCVEVGQGRTCSFNDSSMVVTNQLSYLYSNSTIPDNFNSFIDNTANGVRSFDSYVRLEDKALNSATTTLELTGDGIFFNNINEIDSNQSLIVKGVSASYHYDRYLKSSMIYYLNNEYASEDDDSRPNPFAEPAQIYSNVENGLGIFAAYNSVSIAVENFPCE